MARQLIRDFGTCLKFNGTSAIVTHTVWTTAKLNVSFSAWFRTTNYKQTRQVIISNGSGSAGKNGYALILSGNSTTNGSLYLLSHNSAWQSLNYKIQDSKWHHIVATIDGSNNLVVFIDGVQIFSNTVITLFTPDTNSFIGGDNNGSGGYFLGFIDKVRVYATQLTSAEAIASYYGTEPTTTPINAYEFDEGSGTTATDTGSAAKNGTITAATYSTDVFMKPRTAVTTRKLIRDFGTCLKFNGINYVNTGWAPTLLSTESFSISAWINVPRNTGETTDAAIIAADGPSGNDGFIFCYNAAGDARGKLSCYINGNPGFEGFIDVDQTQGTTTLTPNTSPDLRDNKWHHIALSYNASDKKVRLYVDGVQTCDASGSYGATDNFGTCVLNSLYVGGYNGDPTKHTKAFLDELVWWSNKSLTLAEIQTIFYSGVYPTDVKALWYKMDEGTGVSTADASGNARNGTLVSTPLWSTNVAMKPRTLIT